MESLGWIGVSCPTFDSEPEDDGIRVPTYLGGRRVVDPAQIAVRLRWRALRHECQRQRRKPKPVDELRGAGSERQGEVAGELRLAAAGGSAFMSGRRLNSAASSEQRRSCVVTPPGYSADASDGR